MVHGAVSATEPTFMQLDCHVERRLGSTVGSHVSEPKLPWWAWTWIWVFGSEHGVCVIEVFVMQRGGQAARTGQEGDV